MPAAASGTPRCGNCHKPLPWIVDAGDATFADVAEKSTVPVLVDLCAPWCGPCRMVSPALAELASEMAGQIKLVKVNVDHSPELQRRFVVQSIPTLLVLRNGHEIARARSGQRPRPSCANGWPGHWAREASAALRAVANGVGAYGATTRWLSTVATPGPEAAAAAAASASFSEWTCP